MPTPLTELQQRFAYEYATNGGNATAAAKAAGYSKTAHEIGRQQLDKPHVLEAIRNHLMKFRARSGAVGLRTLVEMAQSDKTPGTARKAADEDGGERADARKVLQVFGGKTAEVTEKAG